MTLNCYPFALFDTIFNDNFQLECSTLNGVSLTQPFYVMVAMGTSKTEQQILRRFSEKSLKLDTYLMYVWSRQFYV